MNSIINFIKFKIIKKPTIYNYIVIAFWAIVFIVLFSLMTFSFNKIYWANSLLTTSFLIYSICILALMIKWGLFDTTTKGLKNYSIKRENRILKENRMPQKELYSIKDIAEMRRRKSYIDVFVGSIVATITLIISLIFINIH